MRTGAERPKHLTEIIDLVVASVRADSQCSPLANLPDADLARALLPQLDLANWIRQSAADLPKRDQLELLVVHAGYAESQEAQWFRLAFSHVVRAVGGLVHVDVRLAAAGTLKLSQELRAPTDGQVTGTLEAFVHPDPTRPVDLVLLLDPEFAGFTQYDAQTGVLGHLLAAGTPVVAKSPDTVSFEREQWILSLYGYQSSAIQSGESRGEQSIADDHVLWNIVDRLDTAGRPDVEGQLSRLDRYDTYVAEIAAFDGTIERPFLGNQTYVLEAPEGEGGDGEDRCVVGLPIKLHVDIVSGTLFKVDPETKVLCYLECRGYCVPEKILQAYPPPTALAFERALWAAEVSLAVEDALDTLRYLDATAGIEPASTDEDILARVEALVELQSPRRDAFQFPTPGCLPLFRALRRGDVELASQMVNDSPSFVNSTDGLGNSPIFLLIDKPLGYLEHFKRLGADFAHVNNQGQSVLHRIAQAGTAEAASFVLSTGADPDVTDPLGVTPALTAAVNGNVAVLDVLISAGARIDVKTFLGLSLSDVWSILALAPDLQQLVRQRAMPH
jgi:hypothetical protein